jgi:putative lysine transport system substrate-binding protein
MSFPTVENCRRKTMKRTIASIIIILAAAALCFAGGQKENSGSANTLRVGMECAYAPYNWAQSDDSNGAVPISGSSDYAYGYDVMMAKYIAGELGMNLEIVKLDWDSIPVAVQSGTIDCAICGQSITSERLQTLDFSTPYYYASIVGLTAKDSPYADAKGLSDLKGAVCTSQLNTIWYDVCLPQISNAKILTAQESAPAMLVALNSGVCNLIVTDQPTALAACMAYPNMKVLDFSGTDDNFAVSEEEINIGISIRKGNTALLDKVNAALSKLDSSDFTSMMDEAISVQPLAN